MNPICWLTRRRLGGYRDGELGRLARAKVESHVVRCAGCAAELGTLDRLCGLLRAPVAVPEPSEPVWEAFWPQVRSRLAAAPEPAHQSPPRTPVWAFLLAWPRLAVGTAVAVAALVAGVAVFGPWGSETAGPRTPAPVASAPTVPRGPAGPSLAAPTRTAAASFPQAVIHSVEMTDPGSSVVIFTPARSEMTVVWVYGLPSTGGQ